MKPEREYFTREELACPCCGACEMDEGFVHQLNVAREFAGIPFRINSGFRCEKHNRKVGGSPRSRHPLGQAVDIHAVSSRDRFVILQALLVAGLVSFSIAKTYIHVDSFGEGWIGLY